VKNRQTTETEGASDEKPKTKHATAFIETAYSAADMAKSIDTEKQIGIPDNGCAFLGNIAANERSKS
jgi:hypothetical protein